MKKLLCILLATVLTMGLLACSGDEDIRGDVPPTDPQLALGSTANNTYKNDFLGLSCSLPSDWVFYTDEEIRELNNIVGDLVGDELEAALEKADVIYDMYASAPGGMATINVAMEKLSVLQAVSVNLKTYLESQFATLKTALENMGCSNVQLEYQKVTVDGKEFDGVAITADIMGVPFYETLFCFVKGRYIANVTIGSVQTDNAATILDYFSVS